MLFNSNAFTLLTENVIISSAVTDLARKNTKPEINRV